MTKKLIGLDWGVYVSECVWIKSGEETQYQSNGQWVRESSGNQERITRMLHHTSHWVFSLSLKTNWTGVCDAFLQEVLCL